MCPFIRSYVNWECVNKYCLWMGGGKYGTYENDTDISIWIGFGQYSDL